MGNTKAQMITIWSCPQYSESLLCSGGMILFREKMVYVEVGIINGDLGMAIMRNSNCNLNKMVI